jgi:hypothetical protein
LTYGPFQGPPLWCCVTLPIHSGTVLSVFSLSKIDIQPFSGPSTVVLCHTPLILGCSLIGGDGFLLSQDQPMGTELQSLPNPGSPYILVFRLTRHSTCHLLARWFAGLFFDPEDGGAMFLRNVGCYTTDYMASYPRRWYPS